MKKTLKKSMSITSAILVASGFFASSTNVMALEYKKALSSLHQTMPADYEVDTESHDYISTADEAVNKTYWSDLEEGIVPAHEFGYVGITYTPAGPIEQVHFDDNIYYGVFPKYVLKPGETALGKTGQFYNTFVYNKKHILSTGIVENPDGITARDELFYRLGYQIGNDIELYGLLYKDTGMKSTDPVTEKENPYGLKESDVLSQDEIKDPMKLTVYGDIKEEGASDSKKIGEYKVGDQLKLDFSMNASWFKRYMMGDALRMTRSVLTADETDVNIARDEALNKIEGMVDSQIVYTIDIPKGVEVKNPSASLRGLDGFDVKTELKEESGKKKLVVSLRLSEDKKAKKELWKNIVDKIKNIDTSNINVSISGIYVNSEAKPNTNITLRGTLGGYFEWARTMIDLPEAKALASDYNFDRKILTRTYLSFVGKQSDDGRDQTTPQDKPNLITYTFKLKEEKDSQPSQPKKSESLPSSPTTSRVDGRDRIETAINISRENYNKSKTVIVVRHDLFPDSMTASVLAKLKDAPILLNPTDKLDSRVGDEIKRLDAEEVIIVGGQNSVSEKVREELKAYDSDKNVERIAGADRYGTSEMVAKRVVGITGKKNTGVVASGQVFPDALSVGTFASREGYPILLVKKDSVPSQIQNAIRDLDINKTYIAGGTNTISKSTEANIPNVVERMAGSTRYETSVAIAKSKFGASKEAYIASGEEFADALVISQVSGKYNRPTLLVSTKAANNGPVRNYVKDSKISKLTAIGGQRYVPSSIIDGLVK